MRRVLYLWVPHLHTAVERLLAPELAGEPVVVASGSFARGVIVDASPEAEALGVGVGQSWRHARRHAAAATFIPYEAARYRPFTERIGGLLHELTPWVETLPGSEEEFFADLGAGSPEEGELLARGAVDAIGDALGLEARAGLATGKLVARTACRGSGVQALRRSGVQADVLTGHHLITSSSPPATRVPGFAGTRHLIIPPGAERQFLRPLSLDYLWDIQPEHRRRLGPLGLRTFGQLAAVPQRLLIGQFGPVGRWYRLLAAGIDARRVKPWTPHPTVASHLLVEEPADLPLLEGYLERLARGVSDTLVATGQYARVIGLMLEMDGSRPFASCHLKAPTNLPRPLRQAGHELLVRLLCRAAERRPSSRLPSVQALTLTASSLETRGLIQLSLFGDTERAVALRAAIARIQDRFGEAAIASASVVSSQLSVVSSQQTKRPRRLASSSELTTDNWQLTTERGRPFTRMAPFAAGGAKHSHGPADR